RLAGENEFSLTGIDRIHSRENQMVSISRVEDNHLAVTAEYTGEPLAVMGAKRVASATALAMETNRPTLYIEFRKDGKPVDS
ncbi:hypothetical protein AB9F35_35510, partial [Rhizobium leguminosarum]